MTLLSFKMKNRKYDKVLQLDHQELYQKAMADEKVGGKFYKFHDWIEREVKRMVGLNLFRAAKAKENQQQNLAQQQELMQPL